MPRRPTRVLAAGTLAACSALTLGACGHHETPLTGRPAAGAAVRQAIKGLAATGGGRYTLTLHIAGRTVTESGSYLLKPAATTFTRHLDDGQGQTVDLQGIGVDDLFYVKDPHLAGTTPDDAGCWVAGDPKDLSARTTAIYDPREPNLPGAVIAAATAHGTTYVDDASEDVNGTIALGAVLKLGGPDLPERLGIMSGRVNAELHIVGGVLLGYSVAPHAFATSDGIPRDVDAQIGRAEVDVTFTSPGAPGDVSAPPDDQTCPDDGATSSGPPSDSPTASPTDSPSDSPSDSVSTGG